MLHELIYTSAPKGLKPATSGFCTVAMTRGISPALIQYLESLTSYRHAGASSTGNGRSSVVYSYLCPTINGRMHYVLSRICDAGLDYSGRSNKLAHHVVLESSPLGFNAGPAWYLEQPTIMIDRWNEPPRYIGARSLPRSTLPAAPCRAWESLTGDAGWAGALVESLRENKTCVVIVDPSIQSLPLIREALALLPVAGRWQVPFGCHVTSLPPNATCSWRIVAAGSPEAAASGRANAAVIDTTQALGRADNPFADAARSGTIVELAASSSNFDSRSSRPAFSTVPTDDSSWRKRVAAPGAMASATTIDYDDEPPAMVVPPAPSSQSRFLVPRLEPSSRRPSTAALVMAALLIGLVLGIGITALVVSRLPSRTLAHSDAEITKEQDARKFTKEQPSRPAARDAGHTADDKQGQPATSKPAKDKQAPKPELDERASRQAPVENSAPIDAAGSSFEPRKAEDPATSEPISETATTKSLPDRLTESFESITQPVDLESGFSLDASPDELASLTLEVIGVDVDEDFSVEQPFDTTRIVKRAGEDVGRFSFTSQDKGTHITWEPFFNSSLNNAVLIWKLGNVVSPLCVIEPKKTTWRALCTGMPLLAEQLKDLKDAELSIQSHSSFAGAQVACEHGQLRVTIPLQSLLEGAEQRSQDPIVALILKKQVQDITIWIPLCHGGQDGSEKRKFRLTPVTSLRNPQIYDLPDAFRWNDDFRAALEGAIDSSKFKELIESMALQSSRGRRRSALTYSEFGRELVVILNAQLAQLNSLEFDIVMTIHGKPVVLIKVAPESAESEFR